MMSQWVGTGMVSELLWTEWMGSKRCASELGYMDGRIGGWMSELNYRPGYLELGLIMG
jgi:hypothetical protein